MVVTHLHMQCGKLFLCFSGADAARVVGPTQTEAD